MQYNRLKRLNLRLNSKLYTTHLNSQAQNNLYRITINILSVFVEPGYYENEHEKNTFSQETLRKSIFLRMYHNILA